MRDPVRTARTASPLVALLVLCALLTGCGAEGPDADRGRGSPELFDAPAAGAAAPGVTLAIPDGAPTVAFVGDSIGAGLHLAEHQAFPAVLQARLAAEGLPFRLVNASESGRTTAGGVTALAWILRSDPDIVVIELGGNDGLRGVPLEDTEQNLRTMIASAREHGARVLLLGVLLPPNYGDFGAGFDELYPRLAEELDVPFVPYFMEGVGGVPEQNLPDGLHPTAAGHERLAENVLQPLRELVRAAS